MSERAPGKGSKGPAGSAYPWLKVDDDGEGYFTISIGERLTVGFDLATGEATVFGTFSLPPAYLDLGEMRSAARAMGSEGGKVGGPARAASLSPERRSEIASKAARARWHGDVPDAPCPRCGAWLPDYDGFGVVAHVGPGGCGFCRHLARDKTQAGLVCGICGDVRADAPAPSLSPTKPPPDAVSK